MDLTFGITGFCKGVFLKYSQMFCDVSTMFIWAKHQFSGRKCEFLRSVDT